MQTSAGRRRIANNQPPSKTMRNSTWISLSIAGVLPATGPQQLQRTYQPRSSSSIPVLAKHLGVLKVWIVQLSLHPRKGLGQRGWSNRGHFISVLHPCPVGSGISEELGGGSLRVALRVILCGEISEETLISPSYI